MLLPDHAQFKYILYNNSNTCLDISTKPLLGLNYSNSISSNSRGSCCCCCCCCCRVRSGSICRCRYCCSNVDLTNKIFERYNYLLVKVSLNRSGQVLAQIYAFQENTHF